MWVAVVVMKHMRKRWRSWRGSMQHNNIRNANSLQAALKKRPRGMLVEDWEWLVTEHYSDPEFWEGKQPTAAKIFKAARKAKTGNLEGQDAEKYEEIISTTDKHPEFSQFELIEKYHNHIVCFGHGVTPKDVRGLELSKVDLMIEIQEKNQQINSLTGRVDASESNHQKKIEEIKTAHEVQMAEMKESHQ
ncbi:hypothetical protein Cgig2_016922 [Carnegiea gigantea]|uniref:Uncharacterized protein n=1 Tax=Carnegiea gigantea TaxID=171969 RepID=A0A9Q1GKP0_9CARY|nr:hypothetical protein Cgig2_016922 [Carnegiea gigantea]